MDSYVAQQKIPASGLFMRQYEGESRVYIILQNYKH